MRQPLRSPPLLNLHLHHPFPGTSAVVVVAIPGQGLDFLRYHLTTLHLQSLIRHNSNHSLLAHHRGPIPVPTHGTLNPIGANLLNSNHSFLLVTKRADLFRANSFLTHISRSRIFRNCSMRADLLLERSVSTKKIGPMHMYLRMFWMRTFLSAALKTAIVR